MWTTHTSSTVTIFHNQRKSEMPKQIFDVKRSQTSKTTQDFRERFMIIRPTVEHVCSLTLYSKKTITQRSMISFSLRFDEADDVTCDSPPHPHVALNHACTTLRGIMCLWKPLRLHPIIKLILRYDWISFHGPDSDQPLFNSYFIVEVAMIQHQRKPLQHTVFF